MRPPPAALRIAGGATNPLRPSGTASNCRARTPRWKRLAWLRSFGCVGWNKRSGSTMRIPPQAPAASLHRAPPQATAPPSVSLAPPECSASQEAQPLVSRRRFNCRACTAPCDAGSHCNRAARRRHRSFGLPSCPCLLLTTASPASRIPRLLTHSPVAQLVEQVTVNHRVGGSSPSRGAKNTRNCNDTTAAREAAFSLSQRRISTRRGQTRSIGGLESLYPRRNAVSGRRVSLARVQRRPASGWSTGHSAARSQPDHRLQVSATWHTAGSCRLAGLHFIEPAADAQPPGRKAEQRSGA